MAVVAQSAEQPQVKEDTSELKWDMKVPKAVLVAREELKAEGLSCTLTNLEKSLSKEEVNKLNGAMRHSLKSQAASRTQTYKDAGNDKLKRE